MDYSKGAWLKAIEKDGLQAWSHGSSDLKGLNSQLALELGIVAIPFNILVDPSGKIIGKNLHGDKLNEVLAKNLGSSN